MTLSIRPAGPADLPDVGHLHHRSRAAAYADLIPADDLNSVPAGAMAQWWGERWTYERDTHRLNVAADGDGIVGFSYAGPSETPEAVELYAIHVDPARVASGVGLALMAAAHRDLAALAAPGMRAVLWVLTGNTRARRFYDRDGWRADGQTRRSAIGTTLTPQLRYTRTLD